MYKAGAGSAVLMKHLPQLVHQNLPLVINCLNIRPTWRQYHWQASLAQNKNLFHTAEQVPKMGIGSKIDGKSDNMAKLLLMTGYWDKWKKTLEDNESSSVGRKDFATEEYVLLE